MTKKVGTSAVGTGKQVQEIKFQAKCALQSIAVDKYGFSKHEIGSVGVITIENIIKLCDKLSPARSEVDVEKLAEYLWDMMDNPNSSDTWLDLDNVYREIWRNKAKAISAFLRGQNV